MEKIKVLIFSQHIPYPLSSGGNVAQFAILERLQHFVDVSLCVLAFDRYQNDYIESLRLRLDKVRVLKIDLTSEPPTLINKIARKIYARFVLPVFQPFLENKAKVRSTDDFLDPVRIRSFDIKYEKFINEAQNVIRSDNFDIVQIEFQELIDLVHLIPSGMKSIYVLHESRYFRLQTAAVNSKVSEAYKSYVMAISEKSESYFLREFNHVITFSENDRIKTLQLGVKHVSCIPFPVLESELSDLNLFTQAKRIVFIGGDNHVPNKEGLDWFIDYCYLPIYERFNYQLIVVGQWRRQKEYKEKLGSKVEFVGFVENLDNELKDAIVIVPVRVGSGIRAKVLYSLAKKVPVISTSVGCEGIADVDKNVLWIADTPEDFLSAVEEIQSKSTLVSEKIANAYDLVVSQYRQDDICAKRIQLYSSLLAKTPKVG